MAGRSTGVAPARIGVDKAPIGSFVKNSWNPNKMGPFEFEKLKESMERFGFTDPLTVRPKGGKFQIIDGEHRLDAANELGFAEIPYVNVGPIADDEAVALGIILNELRGAHDPKALGALLDDLISRNKPEVLLMGMPFTPEVLKGLVDLTSFDWSTLESKKPEAMIPSSRKGSSWVERTFRLPQEASEVLSQALERAKDGDEIEDWQALERVAADFLAS